MQMTIRKTNVQWSGALARYAEERLEHGLRRLSQSIRHVVVRLADVNGPRGGEDKRCRLSVTLATGHEIVVDGMASCPYRAVDGALRRARPAVRRTLDRSRSARGRSVRR